MKILTLLMLIFTGCAITTGHIKKENLEVDFTTFNFFMKKSLDGLQLKTGLGDLTISGQSSDPTPAQQLALEILKASLGATK